MASDNIPMNKITYTQIDDGTAPWAQNIGGEEVRVIFNAAQPAKGDLGYARVMGGKAIPRLGAIDIMWGLQAGALGVDDGAMSVFP